ncbi:MAG: hypothetical protein UR80_C0007G0003 [Parcubacteria group bacterium GW2011_GWB1_35_5]|nr:MAG: hypothetical protein UR80_C0007G0003 [Parcubacteria group bacterium GW2011_GWB1_35_5]
MYIHVKVVAGAPKESFSPRPSRAGQAKSSDHFEVSVKEKAERNEANNRVLALVASHFKVPVAKVRIVNGHRHPSKLLVVED